MSVWDIKPSNSCAVISSMCSVSKVQFHFDKRWVARSCILTGTGPFWFSIRPMRPNRKQTRCLKGSARSLKALVDARHAYIQQIWSNKCGTYQQGCLVVVVVESNVTPGSPSGTYSVTSFFSPCLFSGQHLTSPIFLKLTLLIFCLLRMKMNQCQDLLCQKRILLIGWQVLEYSCQ